MFKTINKLAIVILIFILVLSCSNKSGRGADAGQLSFCYWNTTFLLDTALWNQTGAEHLYIRYFDVDWDNLSEQPKPIASIYSYNDSFPNNFTPSVFLTNKVFQKSSKTDLDSLSARVKRRIETITSDFGGNIFNQRTQNERNTNYDQIDSLRNIFLADYKKNAYKDILIDCDWTEGTKENFFYFVNRLKNDFAEKEISVTLRLWQYKQTKTAGVPPVDRCLLMCYNMQTANNPKVENSIASMSELKKYVSGDKYPLKLDVALPIFSWALLFRNDTFVGLLGNATNKEYEDNFLEYESLGNGRYRALVDKVVGSFFMRKGDIVRVESVSNDELQDMAKYLKSQINMDKYSRITFFSWNKSYIENYGTNELQKIYNQFSN